MEEGFLRDCTAGGVAPSEWYEGPPEKSLWMGIKTLGKVHYVVRTYRCSHSGCLSLR